MVEIELVYCSFSTKYKGWCQMIKGLIIDLDNCVFDTKSMGVDVIAPVLAVLSEAASGIFFSAAVLAGIEELFDEIIIEANDDPLNRKGKKQIFQELMEKYGWLPWEIMVVGDNPYSELKAGKELGMITVQTLRPDVFSVDGFDHFVSGFSEIIELLERL